MIIPHTRYIVGANGQEYGIEDEVQSYVTWHLGQTNKIGTNIFMLMVD